MDNSGIPYFATFRQTGTVIIRVKMELTNDHCKSDRLMSNSCTRRPTSCEKCFRTRARRYFSDCDSERVKGRLYRASPARSRYVNVCAAVCLVLLVGDILPLTTAAPRRRMSRERRSTEENSFWGNPCDYTDYKPRKYSAKLAHAVATQASNAFDSTVLHKDQIAGLHSFESFEKLLPKWSSTDWLRNFTWYTDDVLPRNKVLNVKVPEEDLDKLMTHIDDVLPLMYKTLKMVVAGLDFIKDDSEVFTDPSLKQKIKTSMHNVRAVLCMFYEVIRSRDLENLPLLDSDVQVELHKDEKRKLFVLIYRDTLNYLEYIEQVFKKMNDLDSKST